MARHWSEAASKFPPALLLAYFLIGWEESFPLTAMTALLVNELHFSPATISTYYAVTFMPWMWKPVYAFISDNFPIAGYYRGPYMAISAIGNALFFFIIAAFANSAATMFILVGSQMVCNAFVQLMVGALLIDIAKSDKKESATLQSLANAAKWAGTLIAQLLALLVYAHNGGEAALSTRQAIALTAVAPLALAAVVPWMREVPEGRGDVPHVSALVEAQGDVRSRMKLSAKSKRVAVFVVVAQVNLVVIGCQNLMTTSTWERALIASAVASCLLGGLLLAAIRMCVRTEVAEETRSREAEGATESEFGWRWARIALFCFLANMIPSAGVSLSVWQFNVLTLESYQCFNIIPSVASVCAALAFGGVFRRCSIRKAIVGSVLISIGSALAQLPFVWLAVDTQKHSIDIWSPLGMLGISTSIVGSVSMIFSVLPIDTLIMTTCSLEGKQSSTPLAIFLACYSFGATVGGLVSAPLLTAFGLDGKNWHSLPAWIIATACAKLLILLFLPLLPSEVCHPKQDGTGQAPHRLGDLSAISIQPY